MVLSSSWFYEQYLDHGLLIEVSTLQQNRIL
jgi:hypothetical protein